jgi:hypothetical protein
VVHPPVASYVHPACESARVRRSYASQPWYVAHCIKRQADQTAFEKRGCAGVGLVYLGSYLPGPGVG